MIAVARLLSVCLTLLALWCAGGAPSFAGASAMSAPSVEAPVHAGHGAHAAPAPAAPDEAPTRHRHADCAMAASHCAALEPPALATPGALQTGTMVHPRPVPAEVHARNLGAEPPPPRT
ncbi:hypothetical protein P2H44_14585 [Albimonas sp. CAU 1670]|uniref:hypothetical protein n=1 Tax=Albimonas sp. CAU 1670 TaxID=3032599 RepID=UPI0023DC8999|nr:hypothetical protein [Albimonas sp. CAU 1670]MDF2233785.1 hypothetical protein [Albimonas sp. CAU 1670]